MFDFIRKISGKKADSECCGVEIKEVEVEGEESKDSCCSSNTPNNVFCCG
ncbi:hypothetical protein [Mesobacillus foraminis]|uniref:Uncharacterized protein n=1 Tax=Mesobacillus foraminis TaxID=279826 RepID=A0A4R2BEQ7_9BACI|nr:hypothetical protein [Mesobacillus foraminis]TCN25438.1 hypothetical protein EV146_10594 [Mesobacillus foraminis]